MVLFCPKDPKGLINFPVNLGKNTKYRIFRKCIHAVDGSEIPDNQLGS